MVCIIWVYISYYSLYAPEKSDNLRVRDQKKHVPYTRIWEPDSEDEKKTRLQEKPDAETKNNFACWILGK